MVLKDEMRNGKLFIVKWKRDFPNREEDGWSNKQFRFARMAADMAVVA